MLVCAVSAALSFTALLIIVQWLTWPQSPLPKTAGQFAVIVHICTWIMALASGAARVLKPPRAPVFVVLVAFVVVSSIPFAV